LEELYQLHELLSKWILDPSWNKTSDAWANIVETRRQVEIAPTIIRAAVTPNGGEVIPEY
jgi:hypothetical protein